MDLDVLAKIILEAQSIRDSSFDEESFKTILKVENREQDPEAFYDKTIYESVDEVITEAGLGLRELQLVFILLSHSWNDARLWAETVLKDVDDEVA